jgi:hypothetical protein
MPDKKVKFTRWSFGLVFLLSFVLNNIWQGGKNLWAFWISRFLSGSEIIVFGLAFIFFPYFMLRVCLINKEDLKDNPKWMFRVIVPIFGISLVILAIYALAPVIGRYLTECRFHICLPSVP